MVRRYSMVWFALRMILFVCLSVSRAQAGEVDALPSDSGSGSQGALNAIFGESGQQFMNELGSVQTFVQNNPVTLAPNGDFVTTGSSSAAAGSSSAARGGRSGQASSVDSAAPKSSSTSSDSSDDAALANGKPSANSLGSSSVKASKSADSARVGEVGRDNDDPDSVGGSNSAGTGSTGPTPNASSASSLWASLSGVGSAGNLPSLLSSFQNATESMGGIQRQADTRDRGNNRDRNDSNSSIDSIDPNGSSVRFGNTKDGAVGDLLARRGEGNGDQQAGDGKKGDKSQGQDDKKKDDGKDDSKVDAKKMGSDVKGMLDEDPFVPSKSKYLELGKLLQQPGLVDNMVGPKQKDSFRNIAQKMFDKYQLADTDSESGRRKNAYQDFLNRKEDDDVFGPTRPNEDAPFHGDDSVGANVPVDGANGATTNANPFQRPLSLPSDHQ